MAAPPPSRSRAYRGGGGASTEVTLALEGLGVGATNPMQKPATVNQVSTHFILNIAGLNLNLKHLDLAYLPPVG